jgi:hypothetical protein
VNRKSLQQAPGTPLIERVEERGMASAGGGGGGEAAAGGGFGEIVIICAKVRPNDVRMGVILRAGSSEKSPNGSFDI